MKVAGLCPGPQGNLYFKANIFRIYRKVAALISLKLGEPLFAVWDIGGLK